MNILPEGWSSLEETPPNKLVSVIDVEGAIATAVPTYYPFRVVPNPNKSGKWTSDVVPCEEYWDGGWMIHSSLSNLNEVGEIIGWKEM